MPDRIFYKGLDEQGRDLDFVRIDVFITIDRVRKGFFETNGFEFDVEFEYI
ncbi:MAG: hypothetical protein IPP25_06905 [Saprospiraceae bacterium]|nr:hypothetical protein [Candidatus Opimibacter skivensis]